MIYSSQDMLRRLHETKAVSVWNHKTGPIFWYAAGVPGPFYVNTELVVGPALSKKLLEGITAILAETKDAPSRAERLEKLVMDETSDETFRNVIETLAARIKAEFPAGSYSVISGGERRDWLFSIPVAKLLGVPHAYLFKNGAFYCDKPLEKGGPALHVCDLINNASSHFENWFPILEKNGLSCPGTICVNSRGVGAGKLQAADKKVVALYTVDISFFEDSGKSGLVDQDTVEELKVFFGSSKDWASRYVMERPELFNAATIDAKSFERLRSFFSSDPWGLRALHPAFFAAMDKAIEERVKKED